MVRDLATGDDGGGGHCAGSSWGIGLRAARGDRRQLPGPGPGPGRLRRGPVCGDGWLAARQDRIEDALRRGTWPAGPWSFTTSRPPRSRGGLPLGAIGHPKDGVRGGRQIVYGLLTSKTVSGAIEVLAGSSGDPTTVASQVARVRTVRPGTRGARGRRGHADRGAAARGRRPAGLDWITALRAPQVKALVGTPPARAVR